MTTIVGDARSGLMVSDSMCSWSGRWWPATKLYRVRGGILGCAGSTPDIEKMIGWYMAGCPKKKPRGELDCNGLILRPTGLYAVDAYCQETLIELGFFAIGSGGDAALGALHAGASPRRAAEIAAEVDTNSSGPFVTMSLADENTPA
jgi:hypothetical protein